MRASACVLSFLTCASPAKVGRTKFNVAIQRFYAYTMTGNDKYAIDMVEVKDKLIKLTAAISSLIELQEKKYDKTE